MFQLYTQLSTFNENFEVLRNLTDESDLANFYFQVECFAVSFYYDLNGNGNVSIRDEQTWLFLDVSV